MCVFFFFKWLLACCVFTIITHSTKKPVTTMLTYPWKCTVLHCNHLENTWKPLVLMTRHFDYCPSASEGDNQSVRSSALVVSRCFPGGYNVKLYISRGRLAWWLLAFLHSAHTFTTSCLVVISIVVSVILQQSPQYNDWHNSNYLVWLNFESAAKHHLIVTIEHAVVYIL